MEITLEAVEKVMAEAEVEFAEAKAALIGADGNAEAAIEAIKASRAAVEEAAEEVQDLGAKVAKRASQNDFHVITPPYITSFFPCCACR